MENVKLDGGLGREDHGRTAPAAIAADPGVKFSPPLPIDFDRPVDGQPGRKASIGMDVDELSASGRRREGVRA